MPCKCGQRDTLGLKLQFSRLAGLLSSCGVLHIVCISLPELDGVQHQCHSRATTVTPSSKEDKNSIRNSHRQGLQGAHEAAHIILSPKRPNMHRQYGANLQSRRHGQHRTTQGIHTIVTMDRSANAGPSCLAELQTHSPVLSILLTVSSPPPLERHHHATAAAMIPRFHKVYAARKHCKASGPKCHCFTCRGRLAAGAGTAPAVGVSPLPCAKRKPASADGNCQGRPHQRTLHMCWHVIVAAGTQEHQTCSAGNRLLTGVQ